VLKRDEKDGLSETILRYICVAGEAAAFSPSKKLNEKEINVANFCAKCGAEQSSDKQFCTACGAPAAVTAAVAMPAQQAVVPPKSGSSALKIILIIVAVLVGLGILGAGAVGFTVWRIARAVHVSGSGPNSQVSLNLPGGAITANTTENFSASDLGTDIYPGAQPGKGSMRMTMPSGSMVSAVFVTSDPKDQVVSFYKGKLGSDASVFDYASSASLSLNKGKQESIMVTITSSPAQYDGKTQIHIVHSTSNKPS
jgi:hypothetical protein